MHCTSSPISPLSKPFSLSIGNMVHFSGQKSCNILYNKYYIVSTAQMNSLGTMWDINMQSHPLKAKILLKKQTGVE